MQLGLGRFDLVKRVTLNRQTWSQHPVKTVGREEATAPQRQVTKALAPQGQL